MSFCLDDGSELLYGPASMDEPATAILSSHHRGEGATAIFRQPASSVSGNSIAVMSFTNIGNDADNEYFCEGLAEELLNALSKISELKVAARTSAFSFRGKDIDVADIGAKLGVKNILEGSVRKSGDRLRITAQLVNAADGYQVWSERYDREMKDIFDVQDEITFAIVNALKIKLLGEEKAALLKRQTASPEAYEFYLRGLSHFSKWTPVDFKKAIDNFERAINIDPNYALAYAASSDANTELLFFSFSPGDARQKARYAANKALELDDRLAEAHNSLALIKMYFDWDYSEAEAEFKRAVSLNPGSASVHMWYGWYLALMARFDESLTELRRARELDPLAPPNINALGVVSHWSRQPETAIQQFQEVLELYPSYAITLSFLSEAYAEKGEMASAIATIEQMQPDAMDPQALSVAGYVYARSGDNEKALDILNKFRDLSSGEYLPYVNFAHIYAGFGDHEQAFEWLEKACDERSIWLPFIKVDTKFDTLRSDTRFNDLLRKVGFAE